MIRQVVQRNGQIVNFDNNRILAAIKAAAATTPSSSICDKDIDRLVGKVVSRHNNICDALDVETIQDAVIATLLEENYQEIAMSYIDYRRERAMIRGVKHACDEEIIVVNNSTQSSKKISWIVSKMYSIASLTKNRSQEEIKEVVKSSTDSIINSLNKKSKKSSTFKLDELLSLVEAAFTLNDAKDCAVITKNEGQEIFWNASEEDYDKDELIKVIFEKKSTIPKTMRFSLQSNSKSVFIKKELIESKLDKIVSDARTDISYIKDRVLGSYRDGMKLMDFFRSAVSLLSPHIDLSPNISKHIASITFDSAFLSISSKYGATGELSTEDFINYLHRGVEAKRIDPKMLEVFDIEDLAKCIDHKKDSLFQYLGAEILVNRYLLRDGDDIIEAPQFMFMRIAMGTSLKESNPQEQAKERYKMLSNHEYMPSSPTIFNSGSTVSQMSSCYLSTTADSLAGIMQSLSDTAMMSKWAGGVGVDWTDVRGMGSRVNGTGGKSQGLVSFLKIMNSVCAAVNQGGRRKGAGAAYLEVWHKDIYAFMELRKQTGDERLRTMDMNTAAWIPDLFMERVIKEESWTLFCPSQVPDLHSKYGSEFKERYEHYEEEFLAGRIEGKKVDALSMYRMLLSSLFETGFPWITFKDPANVCYMEKHEGVVKSSNLCTEIFQHAFANDLESKETPEVAVCTLGSINLYRHLKEGEIDWDMLKSTTRKAIRMLDCCIDNNYYPIEPARFSSERHRFVGLGQCGLHDVMIRMKIPFDSDEMIEQTGKISEFISYHAIDASVDLAREKGSYDAFDGSEWSKGKVPVDMARELKKYRGKLFKGIIKENMDWDPLRKKVAQGMRNALTCAIAPTATIAPIMGVSDSISPLFGLLFAKGNMSGLFSYISDAAYKLLDENNLWDERLVEDLKYYEGSVQQLSYVPDDIKNILKCAFEIPATRLVQAASIRQTHIDQGQSLNLFFPHKNGKEISHAYMEAFLHGLKSTYYMRSRSATVIEKATVDINAKSIRPSWSKLVTSANNIKIDRSTPTVCNLDEGCESCQ